MHTNLPWRLLVLLALFIYLILLILTVGFVAHNFLLACLFAITAGAFVYSVWLIVSGKRARLIAGTSILVISLAALLWQLLLFVRFHLNFRALLLAIVLSAVYMGLISILRRQYWLQKRRLSIDTGQGATFKKPYLIINPVSGNGRAAKHHIDQLAKRYGIEVIMTTPTLKVEMAAERAAQSGADVIGISGGDGSIGAVAKVALTHDLPIVVLPGGTRCHFARDLGLNPHYIADALEGFFGVERRIDIATINDRVFLNNVSFGLYADIVNRPGYREHKFQVSRAALQDIVNGDTAPYELHFQHGSQTFSHVAQVLIGVNRYNTVNITELGHRDSLDEGVLQVTVITKLDDATARALLRSVSIDRLIRDDDNPVIQQWTTHSFTAHTSSGSVRAGVDGEDETYTSPVKIKIHPQALRVYVPAEGVRERPTNPFSREALKTAWRYIVSGA